jgi:hypothetical protein
MYSFKMDNGIVLSFDTYNAFFHYYADQSQYFSKDLQGDFEFCLDRYSQNEDTIFGRGKTKQLPFFMVKMHTTPKEYQKLSDKMDNYAAYNCVMRVEGDTLKARFLSGYHNLLVYFPDTVGGTDQEHMYSYGNLTNGIYLLENFKYKNTTVVEMLLDSVTGQFSDPRSTAVIGPRPYADYLIQDADYDQWFYGYSGLGTYAKTEWDKTKKALNASGKMSANSMVYICFSTDGKGGMDLVFNMWYGSDEVHFPMLLRKVSDDEIAIRYTGKETSGRKYSFYDAGLKYIVDALAKKDTWTTYKITYKSGTPMMPKASSSPTKATLPTATISSPISAITTTASGNRGFEWGCTVGGTSPRYGDNYWSFLSPSTKCRAFLNMVFLKVQPLRRRTAVWSKCLNDGI